MIANLGALKNEYAASNDAARKAEIYKQYNDGIEKAKAMEGKLVSAAEDAYAKAAQHQTQDFTEILVATLADRVMRDDYEKAFELGKTLMDHRCSDKLSACHGRCGRVLRE